MGAADSIDPNSSLWNWLAYDLRFYRQKHKKSLTQLGAVLGRTRSSVSACEAGRRRIRDDEAKKLDDLWDTGGHFQRLLLFARAGHDPDWFRQHVEYEEQASVLKLWELAWIPGLLQTEDYARATLVAGGVKDIDGLVANRMSRQLILDREDPPIVWVLLWEPALLSRVGGRDVFRKQLGRLLEVSESQSVSVRVVPTDAGGHPGLDGSFKIMTLESSDVAYVEAPEGGRLVQSVTDVRAFGLSYDRIGSKALPEGPSRDLIARCMEAM